MYGRLSIRLFYTYFVFTILTLSGFLGRGGQKIFWLSFVEIGIAELSPVLIRIALNCVIDIENPSFTNFTDTFMFNTSTLRVFVG